MIYSSVKKNWSRVRILFDIAAKYAEISKGFNLASKDTPKEQFSFNAYEFENSQLESCMVETIMVWSLVTLESLVNHAIAETINDKNIAMNAIEYPNQILKELELPKNKFNSELSNKLIILCNNNIAKNSKIILFSNELADIRNNIMHDKPLGLYTFPDGEVEIEHYRLRGKPNDYLLYYKDLDDFLFKCDYIKSFIINNNSSDFTINFTINFHELFEKRAL